MARGGSSTNREDDLAALKEAKAIFFHKTMTASMVTTGPWIQPFTLELPTLFVEEHGAKIKQRVALGTSAACGTPVWWLTLKVIVSWPWKPRVYASGGGWRKFVVDNGIKTGDFLVFELVEASRFVVRVYTATQVGSGSSFSRRSALKEDHSESPNNVSKECVSKVQPYRKCVSNPIENVSVISSTPSSRSESGTNSAACSRPWFMKIMFPSHAKSKSAEVIIPAGFWRICGQDMFDRKTFILSGPRTREQVSAYVKGTEVQTKCCFSGGWIRFYTANELHVGDAVLFTLTGPESFAVSVQVPGSHHRDRHDQTHRT